jgi:hypothetical protein
MATHNILRAVQGASHSKTLDAIAGCTGSGIFYVDLGSVIFDVDKGFGERLASHLVVREAESWTHGDLLSSN